MMASLLSIRLTGFEPTTSRVGVWHSIQLSYSRTTKCIITKNSEKVKLNVFISVKIC